MSSAHLTVCLIREPEHVNRILEAWTRSQLVSNVATCEIRRILKEGLDIPCMYFNSRTSEYACELTLREVLLRQPGKTTLTLAAFRDCGDNGLNGDGDLPGIESLFANNRNLGRGVGVRYITVSVCGQVTPQTVFPAGWDMHLVHDSTSLALPTILYEIESSDTSGLCAVMALCAGGGWSFSDGIVPTPTEADQAISEDTVGYVRIVRPEVRIATASSIDSEIAKITQNRFVRLPPWPEPPSCIVVSERIPVPEQTIHELAESCAFCVDEDIQYDRFSGLRLRDALNIMHAVRTLWLRIRGFVMATEDVIVETHSVFGAIQRFKALQITNLGSAVEALRDSGMPGLRMGMDVASRAPQPWRKVRDLFFGLIDGGPLPKGVEDLDLPLDAASSQRVVWANPIVLAPAPSLTDEFKLDTSVSSDALVASIVGVDPIEPLDVLHCRRIDTIIRLEEDPFPYLREEDRPDLKDRLSEDEELRDRWNEMRDRWTGWLGIWRNYPLSELSDMLGEAVESAYDNFVETLMDSEDDDYVVERYSFRYEPLLAALVIFAIGVGLFAWRLMGDGGPIPAAGLGLYVALGVWVAVLVLLFALYRSSLAQLERYGLMSIRSLERSQRARHYASEVTRLHGLGRAFMDHQQIVRVMLHEPFGSQHMSAWTSNLSEEPTDQLEKDLGVPSILCGAAEISDRQRETLMSLSNDKIFREMWLSEAYKESSDAWVERYKSVVGSGSFDMPDDDYRLLGEVYRDLGVKKLMGPREDFRDSVVLDDSLRTAGRVQIAKRFMEVARDEVEHIDEVGSIRVRRYPAFSDSGSSFIEFADSSLSLNEFDARIIQDADEVPVNEESTIGSVKPALIRDENRGCTMLVSWRMLVSDAYGANKLQCAVDAEETGRNREHFDKDGSDPRDPGDAPEI